MTARDLMAFQADNVGYQLEQVLSTMPAGLQESTLTDVAMTPRESVAHLAEAYEALLAEREGRKHEWGSFTIGAGTWEETLDVWRSCRARALDATLIDDEHSLKECHNYVIAHDAYHVGQLSLLRVQHEPDWNPYSIYSFGN